MRRDGPGKGAARLSVARRLPGWNLRSQRDRAGVEGKVDPGARQAQLARQRVIVVQARLLARPQVEADDVSQVAAAEARVEAQARRLAVGNGADGAAAA